MNELPKLTEEDINEIVYEHYGFTINELDHSVGYWTTRFTEERTKRKQLEHNWNELKKWLEELQKFKGINQQGFSWGVAQEVLDKMSELEEGGNNE